MSNRFRAVNRVLGDQPRLGPFPADQILPWSGIALFGYMVIKGLLGQSWFATAVFIAWGWATWWTVTSNKAFMGKFVGTPRMVRGYKRYESIVNPPQRPPRQRKSKKHK